MEKVDEILTAVSYPIRREILRRLSERPCRAGDLARGFAVSRPAICKHARMLQRAGLIRAAQSGRERVYALMPDAGAALRAAAAQIEELSALWDAALDAFKRCAERRANDDQESGDRPLCAGQGVPDFHARDRPLRGGGTMKLYHFPSPNPQKVTFALRELGLDCEIVPIDLAKGGQRDPAFLALNPMGRVPVLVDGELTLWESHAILAYLGDKTDRLWPSSAAGRAEALKWLFFLSQHIMPPAGELALRIRAKVLGIPADEAVIARGEQALPGVIAIIEGRLTDDQWLCGNAFSLVDCAYCPVLNVIDKAGFSLAGFPKVAAYLDALRARPAWQQTPRLPGL